MTTLESRLCRHDWYYDYSDDGRVYAAGRVAAHELQGVLNGLECPYEFWDLYKALYTPNKIKNSEDILNWIKEQE